MIPFQAPLDDIFHSLRTFAGEVPGWDPELSQEVAGHFAAFAEGVLAPLNGPGDREGCRLENGRVRMPEGFGAAYTELAESGWQGLTAPEAFGGQELDHLTAAAVSEIFSGANHSLQMVTNLVPGAVSTLLVHGTPAQQETYIPKLASGAWLSTMCLTEAGAGSDLSRIRCRAVRDGESWRIEGQKIFISGGDQDLSEGILHLVLARTGAPEDGVKGLSLFLCPSERDGLRNAVTVTRIEEKLGLHASPTCQMEFDGASAELVGAEGRGLAAMFTMMNHARLDVSLQGVAHAARAHAIAAAYAAERRQGRQPDGSDAMLADHPDVQRMLAEQQDAARVARAMCHIALGELERGDAPALVEFLTPLCKIWCTEAGLRAADLGIQILGGYGYLEEYGVAQIWRDARITTIYEGANGIHCQTMASRGVRFGEGAVIEAFAALIARLAPEDMALAERSAAWQARARELAGLADVRVLAHDFAVATGALLADAIRVRLARG
ncbi:acyl-CoA dehydrogenase [Salipiger sp. HF18]|uniref:acyl-CoA dehydrogenase family protein n=1 Tax=Salipiger sp. HF18 TaxID=2721557 RepID=UPI00142D9B4D|nr:acyl-CoA dehydrogenase family protein [Salipiger sp. HF18]NIY97066.1 acyl-CoA dehydrogenase [Salipiger sp. HF18]